MGSDLPKVTHRPGGSTSPHPTPTPSRLFPEKRKLVVRGFRGDKLYRHGQLRQCWGLGCVTLALLKAGQEKPLGRPSSWFLGQEAEHRPRPLPPPPAPAPFLPLSLYNYAPPSYWASQALKSPFQRHSFYSHCSPPSWALFHLRFASKDCNWRPREVK